MNETTSSVFSNRAFTRMFSAYALSSFGDYFDFIAMVVIGAVGFLFQKMIWREKTSDVSVSDSGTIQASS